jgi:hypothetical protein
VAFAFDYNPRHLIRATSTPPIHSLHSDVAPRLTSGNADVTITAGTRSGKVTNHRML